MEFRHHLLQASIARMERSEIRGGIDASRQSRITLRSIRATQLKDRAKIAFLRIFPASDRFSAAGARCVEAVAIQCFTATKPLLQ
jgi:hypothetical protein